MNKRNLRKKRIRRVRARTCGTAQKPRLVVFRSLRNIYAQIVDDAKNHTMVSVDSRAIKGGKNDQATAKSVGLEIAKLALAKRIKDVVFDRHGYKYHGKVKALAEGARKGGLVF